MSEYRFDAYFLDDETEFSWKQRLLNSKKILDKFTLFNSVFSDWHYFAPEPKGFTEYLMTLPDDEMEKEFYRFFEKNPDRPFDIDAYEKLLEREQPLQDSYGTSHTLHFKRTTAYEKSNVTFGFQSHTEKCSIGKQLVGISLNNNFYSTFEEYLNFMQKACEIMCEEKKQIERMVFSPNDYVRHRLFQHRQPGGWMVFYPNKDVDLKHIGNTAKVIPIKDYGYLYVCVEEIFDLDNKQHIERANDLEIKLVELGLLEALPEQGW